VKVNLGGTRRAYPLKVAATGAQLHEPPRREPDHWRPATAGSILDAVN
jgi:hypothetical protein